MTQFASLDDEPLVLPRLSIPELFDEFPVLRRHVDSLGQLYCLPVRVILHWHRHARRLTYFREPENAVAELAFTRSVTAHLNAVGSFRGRYLCSAIIDGRSLTAGWPAMMSEAEVGLRLYAGARGAHGGRFDTIGSVMSFHKQRQRAMSIALVTDPGFQEDLNVLKGMRACLPEQELEDYRGERNPVSLTRSQVPRHRQVNAWRKALTLFLEKYILVKMPSFDMPEPMGRIEPGGPLPGNYAIPQRGRALYMHPGDDLSLDDLEEMVTLRLMNPQPDRLVERLRRAAQHQKQYDKYFESAYIEKALAQRFGGELPRGGVGYLIDALCPYFDRSEVMVKRYRSELEALRAGELPEVTND